MYFAQPSFCIFERCDLQCSVVAEGVAYDHHDFSREVRYEYANLDMPAVWFR